MTSAQAPLERFGDIVKAQRKSYGWSQHQLAVAAQVSRPTVARVEAGTAVSTATLSNVAVALGIEVHLEVAS
ncbi:MAG: helix-turn-helix transcriptional regulator [Micrococcaceae bacterium]|nr:helix-turn-helix transcriptional regulator [Micrococcaceae bacterium]